MVGDTPITLIKNKTCYSFDSLLNLGDEKEPSIKIDESDDADWLYTSGTTGKPKAVMHTHSSSVATGYSVGGAIGIKKQDIYQSAFPFFTSSGCHFNLLSVLVNRATIVIDRQFDVEETFKTIEEEKSTIYVGVPSVYSFMLESQEMNHYNLSSIRLLDYGGPPMPKQVILELYKKLPNVELRQTYGLLDQPEPIYQVNMH